MRRGHARVRMPTSLTRCMKYLAARPSHMTYPPDYTSRFRQHSPRERRPHSCFGLKDAVRPVYPFSHGYHHDIRRRRSYRAKFLRKNIINILQKSTAEYYAQRNGRLRVPPDQPALHTDC